MGYMKDNGKFQPGLISTVIFDFDGTIRYSEPRGVDVFHQYVAASGIEYSEQQRKSAERWLHYYWAQSSELVEDIKTFGDSENGEFWRQHARRHLAHLGVPDRDVEDLSGHITEKMRSAYDAEHCVPDDVIPTLQRLRDQGFKLAILSNRHEQFSELVDELGMLEYFAMTLAAGEVGWWKPDPRLFQHAVGLLEAESDRTVYVGDNYYADVLGARAAGLHPVLLDPFGIYELPDCPVIASIQEIEKLL